LNQPYCDSCTIKDCDRRSSTNGMITFCSNRKRSRSSYTVPANVEVVERDIQNKLFDDLEGD